MKKMLTTLLIIKKGERLLLATKKRGFGEGKINGCGGKCEPNEQVADAMKREAFEELGIVPLDAKEYGEIDFIEYMKGELTNVNMHIFYAEKFEGEPVETDEMIPCWIDVNNIPYDNMFPDDKFWLPMLLEGKKFKAKFEFDKDFNMIAYEINETK